MGGPYSVTVLAGRDVVISLRAVVLPLGNLYLPTLSYPDNFHFSLPS